MKISIPQMIERISAVKRLLEKYISTKLLTFEEERDLVNFFIAYQNTNDLVEYALDGISNTPDETLSEFTLLHQSSEELIGFCNDNMQVLLAINFKGDCEKHLKPFEDEHKTASEEATALWQKLQEISNSLDFMMEGEDGYSELRKECDEIEDRYYKEHARVNDLFERMRNEQAKVAAVYYFSFEMLFIIIKKFDEISQSVIEDINNTTEEVQP